MGTVHCDENSVGKQRGWGLFIEVCEVDGTGRKR